MSSQQGLSSHINDGEDDESIDNDPHKEYHLNEHEDLLLQMANRYRFSTYDTLKTTSSGLLNNWDVSWQ